MAQKRGPHHGTLPIAATARGLRRTSSASRALHGAAFMLRPRHVLLGTLAGALMLLALHCTRQTAHIAQLEGRLAAQSQQGATGASDGASPSDDHSAASSSVDTQLQQPRALARSKTDKATALDAGTTATSTQLRVFIGVFTAFNDVAQKDDGRQRDYARRRQVLRQTWFPAMRADHERWELLGIAIRFVVGRSDSPATEAELAAEEQLNGDFLRLDLIEHYAQLPNKTKAFFAAAAAAYPFADWYMKMDDDVYLMPQRLLQAMGQWDRMTADYVGCMKHGVLWKTPGTRWYEPKHLLLGDTYYLHSYGSIYAVRGWVVRDVLLPQAATFRLLSNEDTTVGLWMLAHNVTHFEDMRLCSPRCTVAAVGIVDNGCAGLCNPLTDLLEMHDDPVCRQETKDPLPYHHSHPEHVAFEKMWVA